MTESNPTDSWSSIGSPKSTFSDGSERQLALLERIALALQAIARVGRIESRPDPSATTPAVIDGHVPSGDAKTNQQQAVAGGDDVRRELAEIKKLLERQALAADSSKRAFLSIDEASQLTLYKPWTIRQACNKGRIKAQKGEDGRWRIPRDTIAKLQEEGLPPG